MLLVAEELGVEELPCGCTRRRFQYRGMPGLEYVRVVTCENNKRERWEVGEYEYDDITDAIRAWERIPRIVVSHDVTPTDVRPALRVVK